jgi:hypothetical protein
VLRSFSFIVSVGFFIDALPSLEGLFLCHRFSEAENIPKASAFDLMVDFSEEMYLTY